MKIFLDMDEVLADFLGGASALHGDADFPDYHRLPLEWGMEKYYGLSAKEFWRPIDERGAEFWANLDVLPWAKKLVEMADQASLGNVFLLTSCGGMNHIADGKLQWVAKHFPKLKQRAFLCTKAYKALLGQNGAVLIDDNAETCGEFDDAGGYGILFPAWSNNHYRLMINGPEAVEEFITKEIKEIPWNPYN